VRKIVEHDEDEAAICVVGGWLADGRIMKDYVVSFNEVLMGHYAGSSAFGHAGRMGGPDVKMARVAILVGEVPLDEPIPMNVNVHAFDVDGSAEHGKASSGKGKTVGLQANVSTRVDKAKFGRRRGQ
jgi:hypothetical protein